MAGTAWPGPATRTVHAAETKDFYYDAWAHPAPPVILDTQEPDPLTDRLPACVNGGQEAVSFEPWAWQGLPMYVHNLIEGKRGDELAASQSLCLLTLIPSGTRPATGSSPYRARNGTVEIAKVVEPDGAKTAYITASGILDAAGAPRQMKFALPTRAAA